ncbi:MAG: ABC transporter ATP-binding protein [Lachnospiraceae bacterium]|nr:ABC transporter ATP-binding protein [Lachnospiraceae bacterium]
MNDMKALLGLVNRKNKHRLIAAVICCVLSVLCGILTYFGLLGLVTCFLHEQTKNLYLYVGLIVIATIAKHLLFGTGTKISHKVAYQTLGETRKKLFHKIAHLPMGYVKATASGQIKTIIMDNMEQLETFYAHNIPEIISGIAVPLCMEILLVILDIRIAGIMMIPVVLFIITGALMIMVQMKKMDEFNQASADVSVKTVEYINGMKELKIFTADDATYGRLSESICTYSTVVTEWFRSCLKYVAFHHADLNSNLVFLFPLAGLMYLSGSVTAASFIMYLFMGLAMLIPLETVSNNFDYIGMNASVARKIHDILKLEEMPDTNSEIKISDHTISFEHVTFAYNEDQTVLKDISFQVPDGKVTAIVGISGSGKSTVASLICRFWDVTKGNIFLGGVPIRQIPLMKLMKQISFVTQNTFLFKKSIRENIKMGNPQATEEEVIQAAKEAVCHDFIMRLPNGYDTILDKEIKLSGGEKQRITIARAILKNAPIVILDEATAYIDADNEDLLQHALAKLSQKKTVLVIAHRLSSIKEADSILVMEEGTLIDSGTHRELMDRCTSYQNMWDALKQSDKWEMRGAKK